MDINESLKSYLANHASLSPVSGNRVYPDYIPKNPKYPCLMYSLVSERELDTFEQPLTLMTPVFQITSIGKTRAEARSLSRLVRLAFKNLSGQIGGAQGVTVSGVVKVGRMEADERDTEGLIINYTVMDDFEISYLEEGDD